jgi:DNA-binding IclR family transcriptional regulator
MSAMRTPISTPPGCGLELPGLLGFGRAPRRSHPAMSSLSPEEMRPYKRRALSTSVLKGLQILTLLARNPEGMTLADLGRRLGFPRTTLLRVLSTFELFGVAAKQGALWRATPRFFEWSSRDTHVEIRGRYAGTLRRVVSGCDEMVMLGVAEGDGIRFIDYAQADQPVLVAPPKQSLYPLQKSACGKLVLGQRPDLCERIRDRRLLEEIAVARRTGIAWNRAETDPGIQAVATWAGPPSVHTPLIAVIWPTYRFSEARARRAVEMVRRALPD